MVRNILVTSGQLILVAAILVFVGYRVALIFDWVPEGFSPSGIVKQEYTDFKRGLAADSNTDDFYGTLASITYNNLTRFERMLAEKRRKDAINAKYAAECQETEIMRFFMFLGGEKAECMPRNLQLKNAVKELDSNTKNAKPAKNVPLTIRGSPVNNQPPKAN